MARLIVDGMNVMGARPDGWWRDRDAAVRRLVGDMATVTNRGERVTAVFDGWALPDLPEGEHGGVAVLYAGRAGADAADDRIVELVEAEADPAGLTVVTSDRALAERVERLGAGVIGAGTFLKQIAALARRPGE